MPTRVESLRGNIRPWMWGVAGGTLLILAAICIPNLERAPVGTRFEREYSLAPHEAAVSSSRFGTTLASAPPAARSGEDAVADRKMVRTIALEMTVASPIDAARAIQAFAAGLGGYVESSELSTENAPTANVRIRVPATRLDEAESGLRKMAIRVDSEKTDAQDVTKHYADMDARLRNLRAEEAQYLEIMKNAVQVKDMLEVSEKLSGVRGEIEQQQAEFATLSKQVETVAITIGLRTQANMDAFRFDWHPLDQLKLATRGALDGLADYAGTMTAVILYLPVVLLWAMTGIAALWTGWRVLRWAGRALFGWHRAPAAQ